MLLTASCSSGKAPLADQLDQYTNKGDGCQQTVSAIAYADAALKPAGQERFQVFDDEVRSKISSVGGTIRLEVRDFPTKRVRDAAQVVAGLAEATGSADARGARRVSLLREYRGQAAALVLACAAEVPGL